MKIGFVFNANSFSGKLTKFFTGCYAYHAFWHDDNFMYDMHLIRRRRLWPHYGPNKTVVSFDIPEVTREFLEHKLSTDSHVYGVLDYLLFGLRPIYHLFGMSTRNANGVICSEMVNSDMQECGVDTPWLPGDPPPSPCALYEWARENAG